MKASIIVLAYNQLEEGTKPCLESICKYTDKEDFELIVVDNNSSDNTAEYLKEFQKEKDNVKILLNNTNRGYAGGNNDGIKLATGDYIILLNNDTLVSPNWLDTLLKVFEADPSVGLVGPVTNNASSVQCLNFEGIKPFNYIELTQKYLKANQGKCFVTNRLTFFCVAIKRDVLNKVGTLDEEYKRGYFEDDDYCKRVLSYGYKLAIAEDSFVYHMGCLSFKSMENIDFDTLMANNRKLFIKKHKAYSHNSDNLETFLNKIEQECEANTSQSIENINLRLNSFRILLEQSKENETYLVKKYQGPFLKSLFRVIKDNVPILNNLDKLFRKVKRK